MSTDPYARLAGPFVRHYDTLRGALRYALVAEQLDEALGSRPLEVVDVGGGAGHQGIRLARLGHEVTLLDPSAVMLDRARVAVAAQSQAVRARLRLIEASAGRASAAVEGRRFAVVLCHAVLPYVGSPASVLHSLAELAEPGALLSLVYKNADALAMRPALEGRWSDATDAFTAESDVGGLGVETRAHRRPEVDAWAAAAGFEPHTWYGIRVLSDHLLEAPADAIAEVLPAESRAARQDPYRALGRLIHALYTYVPSGVHR